MSRPLRSTMVPPRCFNTIPAPALMTMAMPAITAKAANRLPLTPHRGRKIFKGQRSLPIVNRPAIPPPPAKVELRAAVSRYQVNKSGKFEAFAQFCEAPKTKRPARGRPFRMFSIRMFSIKEGSILGDHRTTPVEARGQAGLHNILDGGQAAGRSTTRTD